MKQKWKLNAKVSLIASIITIFLLALNTNIQAITDVQNYNIILVAPYILLIVLAISGINVFVSLSISIVFAGIIGFLVKNNYGLLVFSRDLNQGFASMNEIMLISLMVGGLSGLAGKRFAQEMSNRLSA